MNAETLFDVGDIVMAVAMAGALTFAVSYAVFFNWRKTAAGRSLMYFVAALVLWAGLSTFTRLVGTYPARGWIRLAVFIVIVVTVWRLVFTLWRYWRHAPQQINPRPITKELPMSKRAGAQAPIWYPNQRVIRTAVQVFASTVLVIAAFIAGAAVLAPQFLDALKDILPPSWVAWLSGGVLFLTALASAVSKIMAIPGVNDWLTKHSKLGSAPTVAEPDTSTVYLAQEVKTGDVLPAPDGAINLTSSDQRLIHIDEQGNVTVSGDDSPTQIIGFYRKKID